MESKPTDVKPATKAVTIYIRNLDQKVINDTIKIR